MAIIGPIAYRDIQGIIHWLQITIADNGICTEFKQASETDITTNTWKTIEPDQWPTTIPAYAPSVSQNHFVLSRDSENKLSRHFFSKYTPPGPDQAPIDRVSSQIYSGTHFGPMSMLRDPEKKAALVTAYWRPEATQQAQLQSQYQLWQKSQETVWHRDATHPDLNAPNQPLDFQTTHTGTAKPAIETDLVPNQQWLVKSIIYDCFAILKAESSSSEDYRAALHFLIDGTEPTSPLSATTKKNSEDVKTLISALSINRYMKTNFYTLMLEDINPISQAIETRRVSMGENDPGYGVTIESVRVYIKQLIRSEIQQYFPDYPINIAYHPATFASTFKVGALPLDQAGAIEESSDGLSPQEIRQIDNLYRLYSNLSISEESLTELYDVIGSIQNRSALTQAVANTFRLLLPDHTDLQYEQELQYLAEIVKNKIEIYHLSKNIHDFFTAGYSDEQAQELAALFPEITYVNEGMLAQGIKNLAQEQQINVLSALLNHRIEVDYPRIETTQFISDQFDRTVIQALLKKGLAGLSSTEQNYFTVLEAALDIYEGKVEYILEKIPTIQAILDATFPLDGGAPSKIVPLLNLSYAQVDPNRATKFKVDTSRLTKLQTNIMGHLLTKKIRACFEEPESTHTQASLNAILPNALTNIANLPNHKALEVLNDTIYSLSRLPAKQKTQFLISLINQPQVNIEVAKGLFGNSSLLEFQEMYAIMTALPLEQTSVLIDSDNILFVLDHLITHLSSLPIKYIKKYPLEILEKLTLKIDDSHFQKFLDDNHLELPPHANTPDWGQTTEIIASLFVQLNADGAFVTQLSSASSPDELKELVLVEIIRGYHPGEHILGLVLQRLAEHEAAIVQSLSPEDRRCRIQLKFGGELGKNLAIELECLRGDSHGTDKLNQIKAALSQLPEKITETELHAQLRDTNSPLCTALFIPVAPVARGLTLFEQTKPQEFDKGFLQEIKERLERLDQTLTTAADSQSNRIR